MIVLQMLDNGDKVQTLQVSELIKILEDMPKNLPVCFSVVMDNGTTGDPEPSNGVLPIIGASFSEAGGGDDEFDAVLLYVPSPVEFEYMNNIEYNVDDNDGDRVADFSNKSLADVSLALIEVCETINAISNRVAELSEEAELSREEDEIDEEAYNEDEETYDEDENENDDDSDAAGSDSEDENDSDDDEEDDDDTGEGDNDDDDDD